MAEWVKVCSDSDVPDGEIRAYTLPDGVVIAVYNVDGNFHATDDTCSHGEASLSEDGVLDGCEVECSWHFGRFNVETGMPCASPCSIPIRAYNVRVIDGYVNVEC